MRFYFEPKEPTVVGDVRTKSRFLWFPKRIGNEMRWLERATWTEEAYLGTAFAGGRAIPNAILRWKPIWWGKRIKDRTGNPGQK